MQGNTEPYSRPRLWSHDQVVRTCSSFHHFEESRRDSWKALIDALIELESSRDDALRTIEQVEPVCDGVAAELRVPALNQELVEPCQGTEGSCG